ncbi:MAG: hypothetical protein NZ602_17425, partial [Thermoguttaceae bacterium]|nr:hypothetical protein [Thermoguttaceae bacterium]MDW8038901.1 hypothetical protein [Thermoguttaceae bacterium]
MGWARLIGWLALIGWVSGIGCGKHLAAAEWQGGWYLDGGGYWKARLQVTVTNRTDRPMLGVPVPVGIGPNPGQAALVGAEARAIRVAAADGTELLFALLAPDGKEIRSGTIPSGSTLLIPVQCSPKGKSTYWIYFDNPLAGQVPDFLPDRMGLVNGDLEEGEGDCPTGWVHDPPDVQHRTEWSTENPRSGRRCLKTVVAEDAPPAWIATRQLNISVQPSARYRFRAWVRAEGVKGYAGWYLHIGNAQRPMLLAPMISAGGGTYEWKQVQLDFRIPAEADRLSVGTVLWGTGTAWFDRAELEALDPPVFHLEVSPPERLQLQELTPSAEWPSAAPQRPSSETVDPSAAVTEAFPAHRRAFIRVENFSDRQRTGLLAVDISPLSHRLAGRLDRQNLRWVCPRTTARPILLGDQMLLEVLLPGRTALSGYLYYGPIGTSPAESTLLLQQTCLPGVEAATTTSGKPFSGPEKAASRDANLPGGSGKPRQVEPEAEDYARLVQSAWNLLKNPSFEAPEPFSSWQATDSPENQKVQYGTDAPGAPGVGQRCARLYIPPGIAKAWRGWTQAVAVRPGASYLVAAWIRTENLHQGNAQVHLHIRTTSGDLSRSNPMRATGGALQGTSDWTLLSALFAMPEDAATLQVHLTTDGFGKLWYDGILVAEVLPARIVAMEGCPLKPKQLAFWPVNPLVKLFPDEPAPEPFCREVLLKGPTPPVPTRPKTSGENDLAKNPAAKDEQRTLGATERLGVEVFLARNEQESVQLALRSGQAWEKVRLEVEPPRNPEGQTLPPPEVAVVGYVPVDYPSNYYMSTAPHWHRKVPRTLPACDGFAGLWPDPLLPQSWLSLPANQTQAIWITFRTPKQAKPGLYQGWIRLVAEPTPENAYRFSKTSVFPLPQIKCVQSHRQPLCSESSSAGVVQSILPLPSKVLPGESKISKPSVVSSFAGRASHPENPPENANLPAQDSFSEGSDTFAAVLLPLTTLVNSSCHRSPEEPASAHPLLLAELPYRVHVWNFTLPDQPHLKAIYDVRFGPGKQWWGQSEQEAYRQVVEFLAQRRLQPDSIQPEPIFRYKEGRVEADFTEFDKAADWYFNRLGLRHSYMPWHFYLFGWGHPPKQLGGQTPYPGQPPYEKVDRAMILPEYKRLYQDALRLFWNHVKQKGWADRFVLYISDEPFFRQPEILAQMKALCQMIHEVDPAIPIYASTWHHVPDWDEALDVWGIGHYGIVPLEQMRRLVQRGKR